MKLWVPSGALAHNIEITSTNVQRGDVIQIGGQPCRVADLLQLPGGAKRLRFESGELLTMHARTRLIALRTQRGGEPFRGLSPSRHRR
ncbi:hypothetical protein [Streptomyces showdoensis]|uniref:Uncharacterized protein n=1 Tax=Streptomyces showdoensis TaxID=68268 RepID=A0A2P2GF51_STREW|nr:hypothetical protein [Streptomyces showdoensis]KKZ70138.1 hypothetical protein VO63_30545 [Streptomyces showdoensis]